MIAETIVGVVSYVVAQDSDPNSAKSQIASGIVGICLFNNLMEVLCDDNEEK